MPKEAPHCQPHECDCERGAYLWNIDASLAVAFEASPDLLNARLPYLYFDHLLILLGSHSQLEQLF